MTSFSFAFTIKEPTRITKTSKKCIDNILTNYEGNMTSQVLHSLISDHTAQKIIVYIEDTNPTFIEKRIFTLANKEKFKNDLQQIDWQAVYGPDKHLVNEQWSIFISIFLETFDTNFPSTKVPVRNFNKIKYITDPEITECRNQLNILYMLKNMDNNYKEQYTRKKKIYDDLLRQHKTQNYATRLRNSDNKNKCAWAIVNEIKGKTRKHNININGDKETIANNFNDFLINVAPNLLSQLRKLPFTCNIEFNQNFMNTELSDENEILQIVKNLKNKFSSGYDEISTSILKFVILSVIHPLVYIINNSLTYGIFPDKLKHALVVPIYKKDDPDDITNYRPISLLPSFSKIFEHAMCCRIVNFMEKNNLFNKIQHGYLRGKSTQTAVFKFTSAILETLENGEIPLGLFLDLSKAYDTRNHDILTKKLNLYGVRGSALKWIKSYLSDREQRVVR